MSDHRLLILLVQAQQHTPGHAFIPVFTERGEPSLVGLNGVYPIHSIQRALASLRQQGFIEDYFDRSFIVSPAGIAYYQQITG